MIDADDAEMIEGVLNDLSEAISGKQLKQQGKQSTKSDVKKSDNSKKIQAQQSIQEIKDAIKTNVLDNHSWDLAASSCTIVTEKVMERFTEWLWVHYYYAGEGLFAARNPEKIFTLKEILILFMQQEYKQ